MTRSPASAGGNRLQGYQDIRQLSRTSLLYASMLMEERMLLMGRGTQTGFLGALSVPSFTAVGTHTPPAVAALSGYTTNVYVKLVANAGAFGGSAASSAVTVAPTAGDDLLLTVASPVVGALGYDAYISTGASDPGDASRFYAGTFQLGAGNTIEIGGAIPTTGRTVPTGGDTSAYAAGYDGIVPVCMGPNSGYTQNIAGKFATGGNAGSEFQNAFVALYNSVKADPDTILMNGADRKQLSDALKTGTSTNYQMRITQDEISGVTLGAVAVAVINEVTGKRVEMEVHPWLPQGVCPIVSWTLPIPDTQVSNVWSVFNVQDYMGVDWPVLQFAYESSSYWFGTLACFAPAWNAAIYGITAA